MFDFNTAVLERSRTVPVVVDFWAAWCGPCRTLGPMLEQLAGEAHGRWELVKVDVEQDPQLAQDFGVSGIPAVKMFHDGEIVAEFLGALPLAEVRQWLEANLPDPRLARLESIAAGWVSRGPEIAPELEQFASDHPDLPLARLRLAQALVGRDPEQARQLAREPGTDPDAAELAADVTSLADLMEYDAAGLPEKVAAPLRDAQSALAAHDLNSALEHLVDLATRDSKFGDELARRAAVSLFRFLGQDHEWSREYRRRLAMALHV